MTGSQPLPNPIGSSPEAPIINAKEVAKQVGIPDAHVPGFERLVNNVVMMRSELIRKLIDPRRDIRDECGYPQDCTVQNYRDLYDWEAIACRVVEVMPRESWQVQPRVYEDEDGSVETPWETAFKDLLQNIRGEKNYFEDDKGNILWDYLKQADIECGIGTFSVILLGLDDGGDLSQPVTPKEGMQLLYLRVFGEPQVAIKTLEADPQNPRFGQPTEYTLTFNDPSQFGNLAIASTNQIVHWTRVVHVAEGDIFGIPRMRAVYRRLLDLMKLYGGSAEMYWRGAFPGISLETDPKLGGDVPFNIEQTKSMMEAYMNGLQRYLALNGFTAKSLAPQVVDPTPQIGVQIEAICIKLGIPLRVFKGSERGELASSQDDAAWNDRLRERQNSFNTPRVIVPFFSRLIFLGVLPEPQDTLHVYWPDLDSQTAENKSSVALKQTQAITTYVGGNGEAVMTPFDFLVEILGFSEDQAQGIIDRAVAAIEDQQAQQDQAMADQQQQALIDQQQAQQDNTVITDNPNPDAPQTDVSKQDTIKG